MFKNFLKLAVRNFYKNGTYSIINIFGLSVGLASFIMLSLFVKYESSYDTFNEDYKRIYRVEQKVNLANETSQWNQLPAPVSSELQDNFAEIEEAITIREVWGEYLSTSKKLTFFEPDGFYANPDIFELFTFKFISGNKKSALDAPMKIVLTETIAEKLFPDSNPMGQNILIDSKRTYQVSGIIEDIPYNSTIGITYIIPFSTYENVYNGNFFDHWEWHDCHIYAKLREGVDENLFGDKIANLLDDFLEDREDKLVLKHIEKVHLIQGDNEGYWIAVMLYGMVGVFILLLAAMNFVNLTTAYSLTRAKEIGIKKVVGSSKLRLIRNFLTESMILVFISLLIAFTIAEATLPIFNKIVSLPLSINYIKDWEFTLFIIGITFITGILSGLYPSIVISSLSPIITLKNRIFDGVRNKRFSMRKGLVIFQLVLSVLFVLITLGVLQQFNYLKNKELGFNTNNLLRTAIKETEKVKINEFEALRNDLKQVPGVVDACLSLNTPFYSSWGRLIDWEGAQAGENMNSRYNQAYSTYINVMGLNLIGGRDFNENLASDSAACIVNETFVDVIGWSKEEALGKKVWYNGHTIIGVIKDFHEQSPFTKIKPYILTKHPGHLTGWKNILVRVDDISNSETVGKVKTILEDYFPESNFNLKPYGTDNGTNDVYQGMVKTFSFFSFVSIIIAIVGLFALVSFSSKRKVKEIGIRKVLGASSIEIYKNLTKEYIILILIANVIAIPLGLFVFDMDPSYYKPDINYFNIIYTSILSVVITLLTISIQIIKSSNANPVDSLRYE